MQTDVLLAAVIFGFTYTCSARKVKGILLVGNGYDYPSQMELFDPNSGSTVLPVELNWPCGGLYQMSDGRFLAIDGNENSGKTFHLDLCTSPPRAEPGPSLVRKRWGAASAWLGGSNGTVVVCGGDDWPNYFKSCERLVDNSWVTGWNMAIGSMQFAMARMSDGRVVATGGYNKEGYRNNVAFLKDGIWTDGAPLRTARRDHAISISYGVVSVYGGTNKGSLRSSEYYDGDSKKWEVGPSMILKREDFDMAVFDGELYAIGGEGNRGQRSSVERFDASQNKFVWAKHNLTVGRSYHCALAVDIVC